MIRKDTPVYSAAKAAFAGDILDGIKLVEEPVQLLSQAQFDTACWRFKERKHFVTVGEKLAERLLPEGDLRKYVRCYVRHEMAHARWTERNLNLIQQLLKDEGDLPFKLFNLFEDARIENLDRELRNEPFGWLEHEDQADLAKPAAVFFGCVQFENSKAELRDHGKFRDGMDELLEEIWDFYRRALQCETSIDVVRVVADWVQRFGAEPPEDYRMSGEEKAEEVTGKALTEESEEPDQSITQVDVAEASRGSVLLDPNEDNELSPALLAKAVSKLERMLGQAGTEPGHVWSGKRLDGAAAARKEAPFRGKIQSKTRATKVCLIVDCSGSMKRGASGLLAPIAAARYLVAAFSELTRKGLVEGGVILSIVEDGRAKWERFALPLKPVTITGIEAYGDGEGLDAAISANLGLLRTMDRVIVVSDGLITDTPLDRAKMARSGVIVEGAYLGRLTDKLQAELIKHFPTATVREDLIDLAAALAKKR